MQDKSPGPFSLQVIGIIIVATFIWYKLVSTFGISSDAHFGFFGAVAAIFVIALLVSVVFGLIAGILTPYKKYIQIFLLVFIIGFGLVVIVSMVLNPKSEEKNFKDRKF